MGRKIPAKKHRGVKDPVKQQAQRFQSIKDKINAPPTDPDEQPVPRSLLRLFASQQPRATADKKPKRPRTAGGGAARERSAVAALRRLPGEAGRAFSLRITSAVRALHHPDDQDYPLDLEETDTRGEYIASQRERRQRKHRQALAAERRRLGAAGGGAGGEGEGGQRLRKTQRRALKKKEQQKAKEAEAAASRGRAARELRYERVSFGDVAHAPPALPRPRRAPPADAAPRPGRRDLLLTKMLSGAGPDATGRGAEAAGRGGAGPAGGAGGAEERERARLAVVAAYRELKKRRAADKSAT